MVDDITINIDKITRHKERINILLLGPPGQGKSSVGNSFYKIFNNDTCFLPNATASNKKGTNYYRTIPGLPENIRVFDVPGFKLTVPAVNRLLMGIREEFSWDDVTTSDWEQKQIDSNNKIDHVIYVLNALTLQKDPATFFSGYSFCMDLATYLPPLVIAEIDHVTGHVPILLITHAKEKKLADQVIISKLICTVPDDEILFIDNFIKKGQNIIDTATKLTEVLLKIIVRVEHATKSKNERNKKEKELKRELKREQKQKEQKQKEQQEKKQNKNNGVHKDHTEEDQIRDEIEEKKQKNIEKNGEPLEKQTKKVLGSKGKEKDSPRRANSPESSTSGSGD